MAALQLKRLVLLLLVLAYSSSASAAWTASLVSVQKVSTGEMAEVVIDFTDGTQTNRLTFRISDPASLATIARNQLAQYEKIEAFVKAPPIGPIDTSVPVVVPPTPDPTVVKVQAFQAAYQTFKQQQTAIKLGLLDPLDPAVAKAQDDLKANFIPEAVSVLDATAVADLPLVK